MKIKKMRQTKHTLKPKVMEFSNKGLLIKASSDSGEKKKAMF